jgi:hypothetical protein
LTLPASLFVVFGAIAEPVTPYNDVASTCPMTLRDGPLKGFLPVSFYKAAGYFQANEAKAAAPGSIGHRRGRFSAHGGAP